MHQVTAWCGNSAAVAMEHYLQVRDEDFAAAAGGGGAAAGGSTQRTDAARRGRDEAVQKAVQYPVQQVADRTGNGRKGSARRNAEPSAGEAVSRDMPEPAGVCRDAETHLMGEAGFEPA